MKKFKIDPSFLLYICAIIILNKLKFLLYLIISLAFHELGHILALKKFKIKISSLTVFAYGGVLSTEIKPNNNCYIEIIIYLAGPLMNLLLMIAGIVFNNESLRNVNISLFLLNICPVYPLDGYNIVLNILALKMPFKWALRISRLFSLTLSILLLIASIFINLYFVLFTVFLLILNVRNILDKKALELLALDKYLHHNYELPKKEIKNANIDIKSNIYKGKLNYYICNNKIYNEWDLLKNNYKKNAIV